MATRSMLVLTLGLVVLLGVAPHGAGAAQPFVDPIQPAFQNPSAAHAGGSPIGSNFFISNQSVDAVVPAVAYNSNNEQYLVVWYNDRPGNDDIEAQRVSKRGALLGGSFFIAGGAGAERRYPDVAYNSQRNEYMVVWVEEDTAGLSYTSIQAQRVPAGGGTQGGPITVLSGSNLWTPGKPAVAYASTSDRYLVVWHEANHPSITTDIWSQSLTSAGALDGFATRISEDPGGQRRLEPDLAYNRSRNEFLVVWEQENGNRNIYARRVTGAGAPLQPPSLQLTFGNTDSAAPSVAAVPTQSGKGDYLMVHEVRMQPNWVYTGGVAVRGDGSTLNYQNISTSNTVQTNPAVAGNEHNKQFLVTWTEPASGMILTTNTLASVVTVDASGVPIINYLNEDVYVGGWDAARAAVAAGPLGDYLLAFDDMPLLATSRDVLGALWGNRIYLPVLTRN